LFTEFRYSSTWSQRFNLSFLDITPVFPSVLYLPKELDVRIIRKD
jgi:hypothetical protein